MTLAYDWRGRLLEREDETGTSNGPKRRFYYAGLTPLAERTGTHTGGGSYSWSNDVFNTLMGFLPVIRRTGGSTDRFLHYDHVGNVIAESNTSGAIAQTNEYDAFGRPVLGSAASGWSLNSLHHTGKHWDDVSGLFYFNNRWYDPELGQFISSNTPFQPYNEHPYNISEGNPLSLFDPTGFRARDLRTVYLAPMEGGWDYWGDKRRAWMLDAYYEGFPPEIWRDPEGDLDNDGIPNWDDPYPMKTETRNLNYYNYWGDPNVPGDWGDGDKDLAYRLALAVAVLTIVAGGLGTPALVGGAGGTIPAGIANIGGATWMGTGVGAIAGLEHVRNPDWND
jgi:RHS repeat-associated protein